MPLQKRGNGWRASSQEGQQDVPWTHPRNRGGCNRRCAWIGCGGSRFYGTFASEVHDRLTGVLPGAPAARHSGTFAPSPTHACTENVQWLALRAARWALRRSMGLSATLRQLQTKMRSNWKRRQRSPLSACKKFMTGWLACCLLLWQSMVRVGGCAWPSARRKVRGPTRQLKGEAEKDCLRLTGLQHMSTAELQNARLHQQVAEVGAARERDARFKEVVLAEMRNRLALQQPGKRARRARNVDPERDYSFALASVQLLRVCLWRRESCVGVQCGAVAFGEERYVGPIVATTGDTGFSEPVLHTGLKNLRNSCWLNSVLQCFYFCGPLQHAFTEDSMVGSMVNDVLVQLGNQKWDYVAPFRLLAQLYATYDYKLTAEAGADAGEACELLLERCAHGPVVMHHLDTPNIVFGRRMVTVTELTRTYFNEHRPKTDVLVFNLNPVACGRVNWSDLLMARQWCAMPLCSGAQPASGALSGMSRHRNGRSRRPALVSCFIRFWSANARTRTHGKSAAGVILPCSPEVAAVLCLGRSVCARCLDGWFSF